MNQTYAESQGEQPFDWNAFLSGTPTDAEWEAAAVLSRSWVTCACGNQCDAIHREPWDGSPGDLRLNILGLDFMDNIREENVSAARATLHKIERRAAKIQKNMEAQCQR